MRSSGTTEDEVNSQVFGLNAALRLDGGGYKDRRQPRIATGGLGNLRASIHLGFDHLIANRVMDNVANRV